MALSASTFSPQRSWCRLSVVSIALASAGWLSGCQPQQQGLPPLGEAVVGVQVIQAQSLVMEQSLAGRSAAHMVSEVRPQVGGIILKRLFDEGQQVKAGQVLYQIDPRTYEASLESAKAQLAQAEAAVLAAKPKAERYKNLVGIDAISKQDGDDALATLRQNEAAVVAARAAVKTAQINLDYTKVTAPISGRIGTSTYTPGALVTAGQTAALTTIQQLNPIYVDVTQTSAQLLALRKQIASGALKAVNGKVAVRIILEDGSELADSGTLEFVGTSVDTGTGNVSLRAVVPNPDGLLLPGTYVKAVVPAAVNEQAILVSQSAVTRNTKGEPVVKLVGQDGKVEERRIETGDAIKDQWVVTTGLKAGEQLITSGATKVRGGQQVKTAPAEQATQAAPAVGAPTAPTAAAAPAASTGTPQ
ncbi:efflux RND transporter periplasmic adaptor subunit [Comamonas terrigena]|uniref:efflux RND transporter periplasmic adaptor subunit n=1 Tax=Comamonas terrigena TaxID=32013 RepID=UPI002448C10B|nr:efflux RND transporter periplasmic adaptor subunit [Comamonas terrigena]MDH0051099.1 efflux RND transporter periplasmic adaptor subunit [Comamonas terrigena]MDH0513550.1 efflux RND transporter periplasmic adaptor subunit [Comamonas terrigena]MDH1093044.1 efflux RND transporter periplasmic adaptor subunit [Comamonas terrigena]MDH1503034.1 efflux RND transporter periplasmic adaptor subunit [Comamonas terrigena]